MILTKLSQKYLKNEHNYYMIVKYMKEYFEGNEISQEYAISLVPQKYASRIKRLQILKQAVRLNYIIETQSLQDKRRRIYQPSDILIDDFIAYANNVDQNMRKAS